MFNLIIQQQVNNDFISWISFGADLCILGITIYTTWKTFLEKHIKLLSYSPNFCSMFGGSFISVVVENTSLSPISVENVDIVYDNHYVINLNKYKEPLILKPQQATTITMEPFSQLSEISLDEIEFKDFYLIFTTSRGKIISNFKRMPVKHNRKNTYKIVTIMRRTFNGLIIPPDVKYAILMKVDGKQQTILINDGGIMDKDIYGYNAIPRSDINDIERVKAHIRAIIDKFNPEQNFYIKPMDEN